MRRPVKWRWCWSATVVRNGKSCYSVKTLKGKWGIVSTKSCRHELSSVPAVFPPFSISSACGGLGYFRGGFFVRFYSRYLSIFCRYLNSVGGKTAFVGFCDAGLFFDFDFLRCFWFVFHSFHLLTQR